MIRKPTSIASTAAIAAALSMAATPVAAAEMPMIAAPTGTHLQVNTGDVGKVNQYRRYRRHRHRDRGIDAGDVVAGVVVIGALAAILGSSSNNRDRDRRDQRRERVRYDDRRDGDYDSSGVESAVDMCVEQVEYRNRRVENVDQAQRSASGWNVSGTLDGGERWTCFIDNGGQIRNIDYGAGTFSQSSGVATGMQHSDAAYRNARATTRTAADGAYTYDDVAPAASSSTIPSADGPRPAYPGGPLPGEEGYDEDWQSDGTADDGQWEGDGRYDTAQ
ncbi:MAG: hypothetical protein WA957_06980, partial [Alteraurantiacibacter sp.]